MTSPSLDEFGLIARHLAPLATHAAARGLTDDVAVLAARDIGGSLVITADAIVAGVHFLADDPPEAVAQRVLRVNLSDLAAKGARPIGYVLTLALGHDQDEAWVARFAAGLAANQRQFSWSLLGGDTIGTPGPLTISVTALGEGPAGDAAPRNGARAGDRIWVTGSIGDGALGLAVCLGKAPSIASDLAEAAAARFRVPQPRVKLGRALMESGLVTASADISDGLVADLAHIAEESRLRGLIDGPFVPLSPAGQAAVAADAAWFPKLITGGDDYELVITGPASADAALRRIARDTGIPLTPIGWMEEGSGVTVYGEDGEPISLERAGYTHFQP